MACRHGEARRQDHDRISPAERRLARWPADERGLIERHASWSAAARWIPERQAGRRRYLKFLLLNALNFASWGKGNRRIWKSLFRASDRLAPPGEEHRAE